MNLDAAPIVLLDDNLFTSARVASALRASGRQVLVARSLERLEACGLALINLGSRSLDGVSLIQPLKEKFPGVQVLGFCGHLEVEIRRAARAAGIDRLLTNESVTALAWLQPGAEVKDEPDM
jgi:DNA-binding response OmpR family regulator